MGKQFINGDYIMLTMKDEQYRGRVLSVEGEHAECEICLSTDLNKSDNLEVILVNVENLEHFVILP